MSHTQGKLVLMGLHSLWRSSHLLPVYFLQQGSSEGNNIVSCNDRMETGSIISLTGESSEAVTSRCLSHSTCPSLISESFFPLAFCMIFIRRNTPQMESKKRKLGCKWDARTTKAWRQKVVSGEEKRKNRWKEFDFWLSSLLTLFSFLQHFLPLSSPTDSLPASHSFLASKHPAGVFYLFTIFWNSFRITILAPFLTQKRKKISAERIISCWCVSHQKSWKLIRHLRPLNVRNISITLWRTGF